MPMSISVGMLAKLRLDLEKWESQSQSQTEYLELLEMPLVYLNFSACLNLSIRFKFAPMSL